MLAAFLFAGESFAVPPDDSRGDGQPAERKAGDTMSVDLGGGVKLELVWIAPGEFIMGSSANEEDRQNNESQHKVRLTTGFWMGKYEVTQEQWERVTGNNPSDSKGAKLPVGRISWDDCQKCIKKMNDTVLPSAGLEASAVFRLPTEAEWEYACRAGTTTRFNTGDAESDLDKAGWYGGIGGVGNNGERTLNPVGQKQPNACGLYDMHGNAWEWCEDSCSVKSDLTIETDTYKNSVVDPFCGVGTARVYRGGSWDMCLSSCRSAFRYGDAPTRVDAHAGCRLVVAPRNQREVASRTSAATQDRLLNVSEDGTSDDQFEMAETYFNGTNKWFMNDSVEALYWYMEAATRNHPKARQMIEPIQAQHLVPEEDIEKARKLTRVKPGSAFLLKTGSLPQSSNTASRFQTSAEAAMQIRDAAVISYIPFEYGQAPLNAGDTLILHLGRGVRMELAWIPPGEFIMGSPADERGRESHWAPGYQTKEIQHTVRLTKGYWMGKYEVTQEQWQRVMGKNPSDHKGTRLPVERVNWHDCQGFTKKMNELLARTDRDDESGYICRLPTEAEWEHACRAGTTTRFNTGDTESDLDKAGWYKANCGGKTHPVGEKQPSSWGLYDMHGNVTEWCQDWEGDNPTADETDPTGIPGWEGAERGGNCIEDLAGCRTASRSRGIPDNTSWCGGLRLAIVAGNIRPAASDADQAVLDKLENAADGGDAESQFQMGELCFKGTNRLIPMDNVEAVCWYLRAAAQNHAKAKQTLEKIQKQNLVAEADIEKARKRLQDGAGKK
jgi:formylglycine-generating enzyme required for sulfatase activity